MSALDALREQVQALIARLADGSRDDASRDALLARAAPLQAARIPAYGRLLRGAATGRWPRALPTDVFRFTRVAGHPPSEDRKVFRTSGTTHGARGEHPFRALDLYDQAARAAASRMLFPETRRMPLLLLAPPPAQAPDSSLSHMLGRFAEWFGEGSPRWLMRDGALALGELREALRAASGPVALLGTSFALMHAEEGLGAERFELAPGSLIMPTGGFKGRSRELDAEAMRRGLIARYGVPDSHIVGEYGMTELSSQCYETSLVDALEGGPRRPERVLWAPGWVRVTPVDPRTLEAVEEGEVGLLRIDDLANVDSVCAIQTSDLGRRVDGATFALLGRAAQAQTRGCSLAIEEALEAGR